MSRQRISPCLEIEVYPDGSMTLYGKDPEEPGLPEESFTILADEVSALRDFLNRETQASLFTVTTTTKQAAHYEM